MNWYRHSLRLVTLIVTGWFVQVVLADIRLPKIFADHMVLQRGESVAIWGTADPNSQLKIVLGDQTAQAQANDKGQWQAKIKPPLGAGPFTLEISSGKTKVVIQDVLIGEVWICAGQLNIQKKIGQLPENEIAAIVNQPGEIRLFSVGEASSDHPKQDFDDVKVWRSNTTEAVNEFSAIGYIFGQSLAQELNVPIGVISISLSEGSCESWVPWDALEKSNTVPKLLAEWTDNQSDRLNKNRPGNLYNAMVHPVTPYAIRGVVWWQGETEVGREGVFEHAFPMLIDSWRVRFGRPELPFLIVQLPPHRYANRARDDLPKLWDIQRRVLRKAKTGLAMSSDLGLVEVLDETPKTKIGQRLAAIALYQAYGRSASPNSGPLFRSMTRTGSRVRIEFDHADGLYCNSELAESGFTVAGEDRNFIAAQVEIIGSSVEIWNDAIINPVAVRYSWSDTSLPSLFNKDELPMAPFYADQFESGDSPGSR